MPFGDCASGVGVSGNSSIRYFMQGCFKSFNLIQLFGWLFAQIFKITHPELVKLEGCRYRLYWPV